MEPNYNPKEIQQLIKLLQQMLPKEDQSDSESSDDFVESKIRTKSVRSDKISNIRYCY